MLKLPLLDTSLEPSQLASWLDANTMVLASSWLYRISAHYHLDPNEVHHAFKCALQLRCINLPQVSAKPGGGFSMNGY